MATDAQQQQHKTVTGTTIGGVVAMIRAKMTGGAVGGGASGAKAEAASSSASSTAASETAPAMDPEDVIDPEDEPTTTTTTAPKTDAGTETAQADTSTEPDAATAGAADAAAAAAGAGAGAGAAGAASAKAGGCDIEAVLAIAGDDDAFLVKAVRAKMDAKTAAEAYVKHLKDENAKLKAEIGKAAEGAGGAGAAGSSKSPKFVSAKAGAPVKLSIAGAARADGAGGGAIGSGSAAVAAQIEAAEKALQADPDRLNQAIAQIQSQRPGMSRTDAMVELKKMIAAEIRSSVA